jgi:hypothetical protein
MKTFTIHMKMNLLALSLHEQKTKTPSMRKRLLQLYFEVACDENVYYSANVAQKELNDRKANRFPLYLEAVPKPHLGPNPYFLSVDCPSQIAYIHPCMSICEGQSTDKNCRICLPKRVLVQLLTRYTKRFQTALYFPVVPDR